MNRTNAIKEKLKEKFTIEDLGKNNLAGYTELVLKNFSRGTSAEKSYTVGASKVSPAIYLDVDNIPCYYLIQLGGGYIEGEYYENYIEMKDDTRAILTTQASNKVYKSENGIPSKQHSEIRIGENAVMEYINDSVILYKDAVYEQKTDIYLKESSTLIYADGITAGWSPDGKYFQYTSTRMKTRIFLEDELVYFDNLKLVPREYDVQDFGILEGYKNFGTMIVIDKKINREIVNTVRELIENAGLDIKFGITALEINGFIIRILGNITQDIQKSIAIAHNYLRKEFFDSDELNMRKY